MTEPIDKFKIGEGWCYTSIFQKGNNNLRIFWTWNHAGTFEVPRGKPPVDPRKVYGGRLPLNKIYLISQVPPSGQAPAESPCVGFGVEFMKQFNRVVFGPGEANSADDSSLAANK